MTILTDDARGDAQPESLADPAVHWKLEGVVDAPDEFAVEWQLEVAATR